MVHGKVARWIPFKLYGETFAKVVVYMDGYCTLDVYMSAWSHDEALLLADFITQNVR